MALVQFTARFTSKCSCNCGKKINRGDTGLNDEQNRKSYIPGHEPEQPTKDPAAGMIEDEQNIRYDNFSRDNP
jgi:hypothetical protein